MSRIQRPFLLALLLGFVLGMVQLPAASAETISLGEPTLLKMCGIKVIGLGDTEEEAVEDAKDQLYASYFVSSYSVVYRGCDYSGSNSGLVSLPPCRAELSACGFPRPRFH